MGLFGVGFVCETDGAVAPLRGVFPTVEFRGRGSEVAIEQGPPLVGISDAEAVEGEDLEFRLSLDSPAVRDVALFFGVAAATAHTSEGVCGSGTADYVQPLLTVLVRQGDVEATITVATCDDSVDEDVELIELTIDLSSVPLLDPLNVNSPPVIEFDDHEAVGTIRDNDAAPALTVTAVPERVREGSGSALGFVVVLPPVGREVVFGWDVGDSDLAGAAHTDPAVVVCPDAGANVGDPVDFIAVSGQHTFDPSENTERITVSVGVCDDFIGEPRETVYLRWSAPALGAAGVAEGVIEDDEPRLAVVDSCTWAGIEEADACALEADGRVVFTIERTVHPAVVGEPPAVSFTYVALPAGDEAGRHLASAGGVVGASDPCNNGGPLAVKAGPYYDYVPVSGIATIPAGAAQATVEVAVTVNNDALDEHNETFMVMLCEPSDIAFLDDPFGLGVIVDDDVVTVAVSDGTATEPAREGETAELSFTVALSAVTGREVRVGYHTDGVERYQPPDTAPQDVQDLTATAGEDYTAVPDETLIFAAESGELTQTVTVVVLHDVLDEGDNDGASAETVALRLTAANADFADRSGSCESGLVYNDCALGQIIDNDAPPAVTVTGPDQALVEGDTAVFTVRLVDPDDLSETMESGVEASVDYRVEHADTPGAPAELTADGDDLAEPLSGTVEFAVGETEAQIEVGTVDDSIDEPDFETFQMALVPASARNAEPAPAADSATAQIEDNDDGLHITLIDTCVGARQQVLPEAHACDAENAADGMSFTVALVDADGNRLDADSNSYVSDRAVTVTYSTAQKLPGVGAATGGAAGVDGVDYVTVDSGTFDITAGENSNVFYVELVDDDFHEGHEAFQVTIANAADYDMLVDSGEGVIIEDDPLPLVVVDDAVAVEGDDVVFAVRLIDPADRDKDPADQRPAYSSREITVSYHTYGDADSPDLGAGPGVDYLEVPQSPSASFKFLARSATAPPVSIATIPDDVTESRESFQLRLAFGADVDYASLDRGTAVGTIN